jgi:hypothetical protein
MMDDFHALKELTILKRGMGHPRVICHSLCKLPVNLHRVYMPSVWFSHWPEAPDFSWTHLTHVEIKMWELESLHHLLLICPNLYSLSVFDILDPFAHRLADNETLSTVTHTNLQYLRMYGSLVGGRDVGVDLFDVITLPNLRLVDFRQLWPWLHEEFKAFLIRSKCPLEELI